MNYYREVKAEERLPEPHKRVNLLVLGKPDSGYYHPYQKKFMIQSDQEYYTKDKISWLEPVTESELISELHKKQNRIDELESLLRVANKNQQVITDL